MKSISGSRYEGIRPEARGTALQETDARQAIRSTYRAFKYVSDKIDREHIIHSVQSAEALYSEAMMFLEGYRDICFEGDMVVEEIRPLAEPCDGTGLYLSALLNMTKMDALEIEKFPRLACIGYSLAANKTLAMNNHENACNVGLKSEGIIFSCGSVTGLASRACGGVSVNFGYAGHMGLSADGGVHLNMDRAYEMGWVAIDGQYVNMGLLIDGLGTDSTDGFYSNPGHAGNMAMNASRGVHFNSGRVDGKMAGNIFTGNQKMVISPVMERVSETVGADDDETFSSIFNRLEKEMGCFERLGRIREETRIHEKWERRGEILELVRQHEKAGSFDSVRACAKELEAYSNKKYPHGVIWTLEP